MPVETPSLFAQVIKDHLALKERNAQLGGSMPIEGYKAEDPFRNHPLFKSEEQARIEETMDGAEPDFTTPRSRTPSRGRATRPSRARRLP